MWFIALWAPLHVAGTSSGTQYVVSDRRGQNGISINAAFDEKAQIVRAVLFASATATSLNGFRAIKPASQTGSFTPRLPSLRMMSHRRLGAF